jgi:hypothetical protein
MCTAPWLQLLRPVCNAWRVGDAAGAAGSVGQKNVIVSADCLKKCGPTKRRTICPPPPRPPHQSRLASDGSASLNTVSRPDRSRPHRRLRGQSSQVRAQYHGAYGAGFGRGAGDGAGVAWRGRWRFSSNSRQPESSLRSLHAEPVNGRAAGTGRPTENWGTCDPPAGSPGNSHKGGSHHGAADGGARGWPGPKNMCPPGSHGR